MKFKIGDRVVTDMSSTMPTWHYSKFHGQKGTVSGIDEAYVVVVLDKTRKIAYFYESELIKL